MKRIKPREMREWGIAASLGSGIVNGLGYTVQKRALDNENRIYARNPLWWFGFFMLIAAESLQGVSFTLLPASVVVALGSFSIAANAVFARLCNDERMKRWTIVGTGCVLLGSIYLAVITPPAREIDTSDEFESILVSPASIAYHSFALLIGIVLYLLLKRLNIYLLAVFAAVTSSITVLWFRPLIFCVIHWEEWASGYLPYASLGIVAVTGIWSAAVLEPYGLKRHAQSEWVPVHFVACVVFFGSASELVYRDWQLAGTKASGVVTFLSSLLLIGWGVYLVPETPEIATTTTTYESSRL